MQLAAAPIQIISAPNYYKPIKDNRWELINPNQQTLSFQLSISDELGFRRFIPASGSSITVEFQRADSFQVNVLSNSRLQSETRTVSKSATVNSDDRSLWSISLTTADVQGVVSGTVKFTLTQSGVATTWVQNYFLKKNLTNAGF